MRASSMDQRYGGFPRNPTLPQNEGGNRMIPCILRDKNAAVLVTEDPGFYWRYGMVSARCLVMLEDACPKVFVRHYFEPDLERLQSAKIMHAVNVRKAWSHTGTAKAVTCTHAKCAHDRSLLLLYDLSLGSQISRTKNLKDACVRLCVLHGLARR